PARVAPDVYPAGGDGFAVRYRELLTELTALEVLRDVPPLHRDAVIADDAAFALTQVERDALRTFRDALAAQLARLVASRRPDLGAALLVGLARLDTLDRSVTSGRLVLLDAFPADAPRVPARVLRDRPETARVLVDEAAEDLATARRALSDPV